MQELVPEHRELLQPCACAGRTPSPSIPRSAAPSRHAAVRTTGKANLRIRVPVSMSLSFATMK
jgi:mevalonate pyrophosphate decarboxylase